MKITLRQISAWRYLILLFSVFILMSFVSFRRATSPARASRQFDTPTVRSFLTNLKAVDVHAQGGALSVTLRNDYNKTITAFAVSSAGVITRSELIDTDEILGPGAMQTKLYELPSTGLTERAIILQAVVFDDGTTDGNPKIVKQLLDARAGNKEQIDRITNTLTLGGRDRDLNQRLQETKSKIDKLPDQEDGRSFEFNAALQDAKHLAAITIGELEQIQKEHGDDAVRRRVSQITARYELRSAKLQGSLHQK